MNTTRTIILPPEEARNRDRWTNGDILVVGSVRLMFRHQGGVVPRPVTGPRENQWMTIDATLGLIESGHAHIERQITEPWYAEAERQGWRHHLRGTSDYVECLSSDKGHVMATMRGGKIEACGLTAGTAVFDTVEELCAFATPYHMEKS